MVSVSLLELLDDAIGTPEVNVNLEALRRLLRIMLEHLSLLGLQDAVPQEEEGGTGPEAGARVSGQPSGKDELQETRSSPPAAADMGEMENTEAKVSGIFEVEAFPTPWVLPQKRPLLWGLCPYTKVLLKPKLQAAC